MQRRKLELRFSTVGVVVTCTIYCRGYYDTRNEGGNRNTKENGLTSVG